MADQSYELTEVPRLKGALTGSVAVYAGEVLVSAVFHRRALADELRSRDVMRQLLSYVVIGALIAVVAPPSAMASAHTVVDVTQREAVTAAKTFMGYGRS